MDQLFGSRADVTPLDEVDSFSKPSHLEETESALPGSEEERSDSDDPEMDPTEGDYELNNNFRRDGNERLTESDHTGIIRYRARRMIQSEEEEEEEGKEREEEEEEEEMNVPDVVDWVSQIKDIINEAEERGCEQSNAENIQEIESSQGNNDNLDLRSKSPDTQQQLDLDPVQKNTKRRKQNNNRRVVLPSLASSNSQSQRSSIATAILESSSLRNEKLESIELKKLEAQESLEKMRTECERAKVELEYTKAEKHYEVSDRQVKVEERKCALEEKKLELEEKKMMIELESQRLNAMAQMLKQGIKVDEAKKIFDYLRILSNGENPSS
ncbi:hypothetical protein FBU30_010794 [Linnemannia zychae]|nr:hypothetical protein FBU30_010794 [Linnemannia zychae]